MRRILILYREDLMPSFAEEEQPDHIGFYGQIQIRNSDLVIFRDNGEDYIIKDQYGDGVGLLHG